MCLIFFWGIAVDLFKLTLEARNPERNCFRFWEVRVGPDLFEELVVTTQWGRLYTSGEVKTLVAAGQKEAQKEIRKQIRRRSSSPKRIGIGYEISCLFDPFDWLNGDIILKEFDRLAALSKTNEHIKDQFNAAKTGKNTEQIRAAQELSQIQERQQQDRGFSMGL
jgi:predicted DNA-binding WGR domain protein